MRKEFSDLPALVQMTAGTHAAMLERALPGRLEAYYVVGSAALGDFVPGRSDVDFVAVTSAPLNPEEIGAIERIHRAQRGKKWLAVPDGFYTPASGFTGDASALLACPRFNEGRYLGLKPFALNSPDGWTLRQYGVRAAGGGPDPVYPVDWARLICGMAENLNTYWRKWVHERRACTPEAAGLLMSPKATEWGVLGISRLYYTFRELDVATKTGAGEYALGHLPARWHGIVREALEARRGGPGFSPSAGRRRETLAFMEFMLDECARVRGCGGNP